MKKIALFAFNGEPMCFAHVLLNAVDLAGRGHEVTVVIEGAATRLVKEYREDHTLPFARMYHRAIEEGLIGCVCEACSAQMGSQKAAESQQLPVCGEMSGHPSIGRYLEQGYEIITF
ncbi:MAG: DsrE family protein [Deltaproteobacteria bacterium]|nr:DsrE family protein [Deltaproteobacteria bacterium]